MSKANKKNRSHEAPKAEATTADGSSAANAALFRDVIGSAKPGGKSNLAVAFWYHEHGDMVRARKFAQVVAQPGDWGNEVEVARKLSKLLAGEAPVGETPTEVAQELIRRTTVPGKSYVFALVAAGVFALLVTLALLRTTPG